MSDFYYSLMYAVIPITACIIDTVYGDPRSNFHPVVLIGNLISYIENKLYPKKPALPKDLMLRGLLTVCLVLLTVGLITSFFVYLGHKGGILLYFSLSALILYVTITPRALARDGMEIYHLLRDGDLVKVRARLSWIVGRDTDNLSEADIASVLFHAFRPCWRCFVPRWKHHGFHAWVQRRQISLFWPYCRQTG